MSLYSKPLDPTRKEIRRLVLRPLSAGDAIQCSAETVSLFDGPDYEALSYVWGDASSQISIMFDGLPYPVTNNLAIALHHLRLPEKPRRLWVDALCINQSSTEERNEQVKMMGEIYANAKPVLIWLGEGTDGSDEAFALISKIASDKVIEEEISQRLFAFFMQLVEREWFTRLWTVQELVLASQDPLIGCGYAWSTWSVLLGTWQKVSLTEFTDMGMVIFKDQGESDEQKGIRPAGIKIDLLNNLRTAVTTKAGEELRDLLLNTNSSKATEPRDRIYGLLGMMRKKDRESFIVDYNLPVGTVFAEAIAHIFQKGTGPFLLSGMELAGSSLQTSVPSWVPRFGSTSLLKPTRFHPPGIGVSGSGSNCENGTVDPDLKTLRVRGLSIDIVLDKISFGEGGECLIQLAQVEALASKARQLAALHTNHRPYLHDLKSKEAIWRTLIANKTYSGAARTMAPESYSEMYKMLRHRQDSTTLNHEQDDEYFREYKLCLLNHLPSGCFFITATGFYGIGPGTVENGDQLAIWFGAPAPFVLRQIPQTHNEHDERIYTVCGVAYVAGIMEGEMVDEVYCEDLEDDVLFIVQ